jgi:hypothetical protein
MSLAEKFQITVPAAFEDGEAWADVNSTRIHEGVPPPKVAGRFNKMPPGYDATSKLDCFSSSLAGQSDVTNSITPESLEHGFLKKPMKGTDDQYGGEHIDLFYGDSGGFVERNNYLDRE